MSSESNGTVDEFVVFMVIVYVPLLHGMLVRCTLSTILTYDLVTYSTVSVKPSRGKRGVTFPLYSTRARPVVCVDSA